MIRGDVNKIRIGHHSNIQDGAVIHCTYQKTETTIVEAFKSAFKLFKKKRLICVFIYSFTTWLVIMSFAGYWLKNYLIHVHEYSEVQALNLIQVYWASFMIASLLVSIMIK